MEEDPAYSQLYHKWSMKYRRYVDRYIMYRQSRWIVTLAFIGLYIYRIYLTRSYFVVSYVLGLYLMQSFLKYFTPLGLPDVDDDDDENLDFQLPSQLNASNDRPLLRSMSEISLWESVTLAVILGNGATCFIIFDLPVFWPFLFSYFIMIVIMTFKKYLKHMHKYGYSLQDFGKNRNRSYQR